MMTSQAHHHFFFPHSLLEDEDESKSHCHLLPFFHYLQKTTMNPWFVVIFSFFSLDVKDDDKPSICCCFIVFFPLGAHNDDELGACCCLLPFFH
jgi:hypothetical protein